MSSMKATRRSDVLYKATKGRNVLCEASRRHDLPTARKGSDFFPEGRRMVMSCTELAGIASPP